MNKIVGIKWGTLSEETRKFLLEGASCVDGETCNEVENGDCIVDLTSDLSVTGKIVNYEITIDDNAIIYNPSEGIVLESKKDIIFEINEVMTMNEAAEKWGITEGAIRASIKAKKFILGVDYRKAGRITLITKEAMTSVYGEHEIE